MRFTTKHVDEKDDSVILVISALIIALVTLFITSGINHFEWIVYILYAVFIFMGEFFASSFLFRNGNSLIHTFLSVASGSTFGIVFVLKAILPFW